MFAGRYTPRLCRPMPGCNQLLTALEAFFRQPHFMRPFEFNSIPCDGATIESILQDTRHSPTFELSTTPGPISQIIASSCNRSRIQITIIIQIHDKCDDSILALINHKRLSTTDSSVAKRRYRLVSMLQSFFLHAAQHLTGQPDRIVFIHPFYDSFNQTSKRTIYKRLRYTDYIDIILLKHAFIHDRLFLVPGESRELPDQDHVDRMRRLLRKRDHPLEFRLQLFLLNLLQRQQL